MYRLLILFSAFLLAMAGMLFLQGGETRNPRDLAGSDTQVEVRDVAELSAPTNTPAPAGNALSLAAAVAAAAGGDAAPAPAPLSADDPAMADMTASVLAGLGVGAAPSPAAPAPAGDDPMAAMTANVLAGLTGAAARPAAAPAHSDPRALQVLVSQALREGQSDAYIDILLNEAAAAGRVVVPEALMTAEGRVDTKTLLASIVREAAVAADDYTRALIAEAQSAGPRTPVQARPVAVAAPGGKYYVVEPGDSLAYIAMVFYGTPASYPRIFEANRDKISSPDRIRVGQRLLIPG